MVLKARRLLWIALSVSAAGSRVGAHGTQGRSRDAAERDVSERLRGRYQGQSGHRAGVAETTLLTPKRT